MKVCSKCKQEKPLDEFFANARSKDGRRTDCKLCQSTVAKLWTERNADKIKQSYKEYRSRPENKKRHADQERNRRLRNPQKSLFLRVRRRCKDENIPFHLTLEDIVIPTHCPVFGTPISLSDRDFWPTVDRINPKGHYTKDNIVIMSMRANRLKSDATLEELYKITRFLEQHEKHS
jgi:hypothetical protein